jgi:hypothetical protein
MLVPSLARPVAYGSLTTVCALAGAPRAAVQTSPGTVLVQKTPPGSTTIAYGSDCPLTYTGAKTPPSTGTFETWPTPRSFGPASLYGPCVQ